MTRRRRYIAGTIAGFSLIVLLLTMTGPGQSLLLRMAAWAASSDTLSVSAGRLEGSLFSGGRITKLSLADADGVWAEIDDIRFDWNPWALFGGALDIDRIDASKLTLSRKPREPEDAPATDDVGKEPGGFALPPLRLGSLAIEEAVLGKAVLGEPARLSVSAHLEAATPSDAISGKIALRDLDRLSTLDADLQYSARSGALEIAARAEDQAGGILSHLLDMGDAGDLRLTLSGGGPVDDWRGGWSFEARNRPWRRGR
ncbi:MAG: hypothetical protein HC850_15705 [Rhodomicrobium sp.]|nr:hypothetical protein [Rhodomicrobium sp.]